MSNYRLTPTTDEVQRGDQWYRRVRYFRCGKQEGCEVLSQIPAPAKQTPQKATPEPVPRTTDPEEILRIPAGKLNRAERDILRSAIRGWQSRGD